MIKFIPFSGEEILCDPEAAAHVLRKASLRQRPMRFSSIFHDGKNLVAVFEDGLDEVPKRFVFSPFKDRSFANLTAEITARHFAGFTLCGSFLLADTLWGLFSRPASAEEKGKPEKEEMDADNDEHKRNSSVPS